LNKILQLGNFSASFKNYLTERPYELNNLLAVDGRQIIIRRILINNIKKRHQKTHNRNVQVKTNHFEEKKYKNPMLTEDFIIYKCGVVCEQMQRNEN